MSVISGAASFFNDGTTATGVSAATTPGIAVLNQSTLGGYWLVRMPNGHAFLAKQIDYGPSIAGRILDFSGPLAKAVGFNLTAGVESGYRAIYMGKTTQDVFNNFD